MERVNFKEITKEHIEVCREIIKRGNCFAINCAKCPFSIKNSTNSLSCIVNWNRFKEMRANVENAEEFIKKFEHLTKNEPSKDQEVEELKQQNKELIKLLSQAIKIIENLSNNPDEVIRSNKEFLEQIKKCRGII